VVPLSVRNVLKSVKNVKVLVGQRIPFYMCLFGDLKDKAFKAFFPIDRITSIFNPRSL